MRRVGWHRHRPNSHDRDRDRGLDPPGICEPFDAPAPWSVARCIGVMSVALNSRARVTVGRDARVTRVCYGLSIHLLGSPRMERAGATVDAPRGHSVGSARVLASQSFRLRERLATLLFPGPRPLERSDADGAPPTGEHAELGGDPQATLPPGLSTSRF
jgi:hypothetical protein